MAKSLEHYIKEAFAWAIQYQLLDGAKLRISDRSLDCWCLVRAVLAELQSSPTLQHSHPEHSVWVHPVMRSLLRRQRLEKLKHALAKDFEEEPEA